MPSPWLLLGLLAAFVANGFYWHHAGTRAEATRWQAHIEQQRAEAEAGARQTEQRWQGAVNAASKTYLDKIDRQRRALDLALDSLRDRPERHAGNLPETARAGCAGGTGAELSRPDAEFLSREAARADDIRAGLESCYQVIDRTRN